jgi:hypothetical protein
MVAALLSVVINSSPAAALAGQVCQLRFHYRWFLNRVSTPAMLRRTTAELRKVHPRFQHVTPSVAPAADNGPGGSRPGLNVPAAQPNLRNPCGELELGQKPSPMSIGKR